MKLSIRQITTSAIILTICIISQFLKNTSVYITGPIVNMCLIMLTIVCGIMPGIILAIITPITSYFITGNILISAIPLIMVCIAIGNIILVLFVGLLKNKFNEKLIIPMLIGSVVKAVFMGITISLILIPMLLPEKMHAMMPLFQFTFSGVQLITAILGSIMSSLIIYTIRKVDFKY